MARGGYMPNRSPDLDSARRTQTTQARQSVTMDGGSLFDRLIRPVLGMDRSTSTGAPPPPPPPLTCHDPLGVGIFLDVCTADSGGVESAACIMGHIVCGMLCGSHVTIPSVARHCPMCDKFHTLD